MMKDSHFRHLMWYVFAGTRGGAMRIKMIELLRNRPYNAHQLCTELNVDYRTILHHIKILIDNDFIVFEGKHYGGVFFMTEMFESQLPTFTEILNKIGTTNK
jgi:predicted transcriptional regulator